jgi:hypothetical protein
MLRYYDGKNSQTRVEKGCIALSRGTVREINKYVLTGPPTTPSHPMGPPSVPHPHATPCGPFGPPSPPTGPHHPSYRYALLSSHLHPPASYGRYTLQDDDETNQGGDVPRVGMYILQDERTQPLIPTSGPRHSRSVPLLSPPVFESWLAA